MEGWVKSDISVYIAKFHILMSPRSIAYAALLTYNTADGQDSHLIAPGRLPPQFRKTSFKKLEHHSPLEGESERSSRMAKADPEGGHRRRLRAAAPNGEG